MQTNLSFSLQLFYNKGEDDVTHGKDIYIPTFVICDVTLTHDAVWPLLKLLDYIWK